MVYLGYMLPTSEKYEERVKEEARIHEVSIEQMLEIIIDFWKSHR